MTEIPGVHAARPGEDEQHCAICLARIRAVSGGQGRTWVHSDSGAVAAPGTLADHGVMIEGEIAARWGG